MEAAVFSVHVSSLPMPELEFHTWAGILLEAGQVGPVTFGAMTQVGGE